MGAAGGGGWTGAQRGGADTVVMLESMHPMEALRMKQREPIDFMSAMRPETKTINQTLRMMGTYATGEMRGSLHH